MVFYKLSYHVEVAFMGRPEDERIKIPALLHLTRLGYSYASLKNITYDTDTDIFTSVFHNTISRINGKSYTDAETADIIRELKQVLDAEDLGRQFYQYVLKGYKGISLVDFDHPEKNTWQIVTELPCINGQDEFRPDITILINGIPLASIEVKRPNNKDGIQAEYDRMNRRIKNRKFRRFINMTQLMVFSNNGEYDDNETVPLEGAFYATTGYEKLFFSHFREEDESIFSQIAPLNPQTEEFILLDNDGNMILTDGLVLQDKKIWKEFLGKDIIPESNSCELYFEEADIEGFVERLEAYYPVVRYVNRLMTHSWGQKVIRFYDPDGNLIEVGTPM